MEPLSVTANGLAIISVAFQLTEACIKLHRFWESVEDAPHEIAAIKEDLQYLISVFKRVESNENPLGHCIEEGVHHCRVKVMELMSIVEKFDVGFQSLSRKKRVWTAFKAATHSKHVQSFRHSLNETKATLTLAMVHESVIQARANKFFKSVNVFEGSHQNYTTEKVRHALPGAVTPAWTQVHSSPSNFVGQRSIHRIPLTNDVLATNTLMHIKKAIPKQSMAKFQTQELMLRAIAQTAISSFESTSLEIFAQDGYMIDEWGQLRSKTFVYAANLRYRIRHHTSSFRTVLGCAWVRTTNIYLANDAENKARKSQTATSFALYPTAWLKYLGIQNGLEALVASAGRSWLFNCRLTVTCPVPEDSLIFELCRTGETRAVEILLAKRLASVVDTSPKGWKPLHFAAAAGHVDLCAMLIRAGADKSALVYEGPSESILSPISLFVACSTDLHAETKIAMLRLFCDCIDLASPESDGWNVHDWLKRAYARERVPISQNSITWLFYMAANEEYVECSPRNIWSALQHAVRSVLNHERHSRYLERILELSQKEHGKISQQRVDALGFWIALRVSGRVILPMVVQAGSIFHMRGFDWTEGYMPRRQYLQAIPDIYAAWCHAVLDTVEKLEDYMRQELDLCMRQLGWTRDDLIGALSYTGTASYTKNDQNLHKQVCTRCKDDFGPLACSLVEPARIAVTECVKTGHNSDCVCQSIYNDNDIPAELPDYTGMCHDDHNGDEPDTDEEFFDAQPHLFDSSSPQSQPNSNMFSDIATLLYSAQGRTWTSRHAIGERLCATCFLLKEHYIGEDGLAADFPPMPKSFEGLRPKW